MTALLSAVEEPSRAKTATGVAKRWGIRVLLACLAVFVAWKLFIVAMQVATDDLWFDSVHDGSVYTTMLVARVVLFCAFGVIAGLVGGLTTLAVCRLQPRLRVHPENEVLRSTFRKYEPRARWLVVLLGVVIPGVLAGSRASSHWQTYLLWRHSTAWHAKDLLFHKDISFFVEVYPFHLLVAALLSQVFLYALLIAAIGGYWYGGWRVRGGKQKVSRGFVTLVSVLLACYVALKAVHYWLSRYALTTSGTGPVTGSSYADVHAGLPSKYALVGIAALCALALLATILLSRRVRVLAATVTVLVVASALVGSAWPALAYHLQEAPSAAQVDLSEIAHNQKATMAAFGLDGDVTTLSYKPTQQVHGTDLVNLANKTAQVPLIDPNQLSPTFNVKQQLQAYYGFKRTLDIGHYDIGGRSQDVAIAARELHLGGVPDNSWVNDHLVYTHGYGVVAAPTSEMDPKTESPVFLDGGMPPGKQIPVTRPQIYFGQAFGASSYAIVGQPSGSHEKLEFDHPGRNGSARSAHTTYTGDGGIPIGSTLRRLLFAVRLHGPDILFSSELNSASQLLMVRNPRARVAKLAPWLTLDGDVYPAVVNGKIKWIVDAYTTSKNYPDSQLVNLHAATATTLTADGDSVAQPSRRINYMRNSVKAVVDAYTGKVTLYAWDQLQHPDPLLQAWESVFPGLVQPQSSIPSALLQQLRYPADLFNVQRTLLAKYHVRQPANFYSGNDFWKVPPDPTVAANKTINSKSAHGVSSPPQPSEYISMSADGFGAQHYSLSSPMVTLNGRELAAFIYVDSQPGPGYGKFTVLDFPPVAGGESPSQVQNDIESDTKITKALTLQRGGNSEVVLGDLEAIPLAGRMLYVEPVYTLARGGQSFPILRHVIALYANGDPSFENDLNSALRAAVDSGGPG